MAMKAKSGEDLYFCQTCLSSSGISIRQGPHHVAQKFTTTTLLASAAREKVPEVPSTEIGHPVPDLGVGGIRIDAVLTPGGRNKDKKSEAREHEDLARRA